MPTEDIFKGLYNVSLSNVTDEWTRKELEKGVGSFLCDKVKEDIPEFDDAPCEKVISGENNSFVGLGRDRNARWASGTGGRGLTDN